VGRQNASSQRLLLPSPTPELYQTYTYGCSTETLNNHQPNCSKFASNLSSSTRSQNDDLKSIRITKSRKITQNSPAGSALKENTASKYYIMMIDCISNVNKFEPSLIQGEVGCIRFLHDKMPYRTLIVL